MKSFLWRLAGAGAIAALAGCAGTNFVRSDTDSLALGRTTYAEVVAKMGAPRSEGVVTKNDKQLKSLNYAYSEAYGRGVRAGVVPARGQTFYFFGDRLVGHEFVSSWAEDSTDFDDARIPGIVKGKTTKAELVGLLGKPSGYGIYPLIKSPTGEAALYTFAQVTKAGLFGMKVLRKTLVVSLNEAAVVTDVEYAAEGER